MVDLVVANQVVCHEVTCQVVHVNPRRDVVAILQCVDKGVEVVLDGVEVEVAPLFVEVRVFDVHGEVVWVGMEAVCLVIVGVEFEKGGVLFIFDVDAIVVESHLFREVVAAPIIAVEV